MSSVPWDMYPEAFTTYPCGCRQEKGTETLVYFCPSHRPVLDPYEEALQNLARIAADFLVGRCSREALAEAVRAVEGER